MQVIEFYVTERVVLQQAQKLSDDLDAARLYGLTDEWLAILNREAKALCRLIRQD